MLKRKFIRGIYMGEIKILILTNYYQEGASSRYRSFNYKKYFLQNGINPTYLPLFFDGYVKTLYLKKKISNLKKIGCILNRIKYIALNKRKYDHIIIETELGKFLPFFIEYFLLKGVSYSLDYDDNPNLTYYKNIFFKFIYKNKIKKLCQEAKFVTVGNKWYYEEIKTNNLKYLPTVIDIDKYYITSNKNIEKLTIVWIGSPSTEKYLDLIIEPLKKVSLKYNFELKLIGSNKKIEGINIKNIKWSEESEVKEISESDIGIMPLENTYWEKGKCGFKLIQYMACGLPVIASPSPANNEIIKHGENGFIANNINEWEKCLLQLLNNKSLRNNMGKISRELIENKYTYQVQCRKYMYLLKEEM